MVSMTNLRKLELIDKRNAEIEEMVNDSDVAMLYKISKLNSESIPAAIKTIIYRGAEKAAKDYVIENNLKDYQILLDISNFYYYI
jgi:ABC-type xylose transport system substrate-binding protein